VLGLTFKENCGDLRNSKVIDIINELQDYGVEVFVTDPQAEAEEAMHEYGVQAAGLGRPAARRRHRGGGGAPRVRGAVGGGPGKKLVKGGAFIDVKAAFDQQAITAAGYRVWRL
jgi:UDP-N-acetyl-D-galactosamine dehydrogenase